METLPSEGDFLKKQAWIKYGLAGAAAGLINGFFGAGGGMVLVPLLIGFAHLDDKQAFSSAIAIILPMCLVTIAVYRSQQIFPLAEALPYLIGGLLGGLAGGILFKKVTARFLHTIFGIIILWGGIRLLWT